MKRYRLPAGTEPGSVLRTRAVLDTQFGICWTQRSVRVGHDERQHGRRRLKPPVAGRMSQRDQRRWLSRLLTYR